MRLVLAADGTVDLVLGPSGIEAGTGLGSAVIVSLLTDARAGVDDVLPDARAGGGLIQPDRRGWAGDALSEIPGDRIGSHLWLLGREKQTESVRLRAIDYARAALQWLIDDGYAVSIDIEAFWSQAGRLDLSVTIHQASGARETIDIPNAGGSYAL